MRLVLLRFFINAACIGVIVSGLLPGIRISGNNLATLVVVAVVFGLINTLVKPLLTLLTCPVLLLTLGLGLVIINAALLYLTAFISNLLATNFAIGGTLMIDSFLWAVVGAVIVMVVNFALEIILRPRVRVVERVEVRTIYRDRKSQLDRDFEALARGDDFDPPPRPRR